MIPRSNICFNHLSFIRNFGIDGLFFFFFSGFFFGGGGGRGRGGGRVVFTHTVCSHLWRLSGKHFL